MPEQILFFCAIALALFKTGVQAEILVIMLTDMQRNLITTTAFVPKDVAITMSLLL